MSKRTLGDRIRAACSDAQWESERASYGDDEKWFSEKSVARRARITATCQRVASAVDAHGATRILDLRQYSDTTAEDRETARTRIDAAGCWD
jgi:hypothetical protein